MFNNLSNGRWHYFDNAFDIRLELEDVDLVKCEDKYYLDVSYIIDTLSERVRLHIPKISLPINPYSVRLMHESRYADPKCEVDVGYGVAKVELDDDGAYFYLTVLEEKVQEMTVAEIEEKLGYKIKIVG